MFYLNGSGTVELTCKLITLGCIWLKDMLGEQKAKMKKVRIRSKYTFGPVIYFNFFFFFCFYYFALNPNFNLFGFFRLYFLQFLFAFARDSSCWEELKNIKKLSNLKKIMTKNYFYFINKLDVLFLVKFLYKYFFIFRFLSSRKIKKI